MESLFNFEYCKLVLERTKCELAYVSIKCCTPDSQLTISKPLRTPGEVRVLLPKPAERHCPWLLWFASEKRTARNRWKWSQRPWGLPLSDFHAGLEQWWRREGDCISIFILITEKFSFIIHRYLDCLGSLLKRIFFFYLFMTTGKRNLLNVV